MVKEFLAHPGGEKFYPQLLKGFGVDINAAPDKTLKPEQAEAKKKSDLMMMSFLNDLPAYKLVNFSAGKFSYEMLDNIIKQINQQ